MEQSWEIRVERDSNKGDLYVVGVHLVSLAEKRRLEARKEQAQPDLFQGHGTPMKMPDFNESVKQTITTLKLFEQYPDVHKEQEKEWRRTESRLEQGHEIVRQSLEQTKRTIAAIQCQERVNAIKRKTREQAERYGKLFKEINEGENTDWSLVAEKWREKYPAGEARS